MMQALVETVFDAVYLATVLLIGVLMIPKTCAYVWTVLIGYTAMKQEVAAR